MSHVYIRTDQVERWRAAMANWDDGGPEAMDEINKVIASEEETAGHASAAVAAIYQSAYSRGYRSGLDTGLAEKAWLHKSWPSIGILLFAAGLIFGLVVRWTA